jgi:hypothetical protein
MTFLLGKYWIRRVMKKGQALKRGDDFKGKEDG